MNWLIESNKKETKLPLILKAAVGLFVKQGIEATTTKQIAEKAGVAEGTLYRHYKGKEEMAYTIFVTHLEEFTQELKKATEPAKTTYEKIRAIIKTYFEFFESERTLFEYIVTSEHRELKNYPTTKTHPGHVVRELVEEGIKNQEIPEQNVVLASAYVVGIIHRVSVYRIYNRIQDELVRYIDDVTKACWRVLTQNQGGTI